jgi:hypothetical protein
MSVSIYIAALVVVEDAVRKPEPPAHRTVIVPSAKLPSRIDDRMPSLLTAADHFNDPSVQSA